MAKKKAGQEKKGGEQKGSKELKIVTIQVVTRDRVLRNPRQMGLLYVIDTFGPLFERTLQEVVYELQQAGADFGYDFKIIGGTPYSPTLKSDLSALLYVGFVEANPRLLRRLQTTNDGKEALEKHGAPQGLVSLVKQHFEQLKNKASLIDRQIELEVRRRMAETARPRRRFPF
ncbi:hypothetical protein [Stetteria hydrogenophila]